MRGLYRASRFLKSALAPATPDWRVGYSPLRGLTISHAVALLEQGEAGDWCDLQWTYRFIEKRSDVMMGLLARYESGIASMPIQWKAVAEKDLTGGATPAQAEAQRVALRTAYERIVNLDAVLRHLISARFRGFAHLEVLRDDSGEIARLEPVPQWHWTRCRKTKEWRYQAKPGVGASGVSITGLEMILRETERPLNEIGLINFVRSSMSEKDWDGYIEVFGLPSIFITLPPNVPTGQEAQYQATANSIVGDARGVLPSGAEVKTVDHAWVGETPFKERLERLRADLVLAGTGGKLTMLAESGSGALASGAHTDTWRDIIAGEAAELNAVLWDQLDAVILADKFPGQRTLAYTELGHREKKDVMSLAGTLGAFARAGFRADAGQVSERTGWKLTASDPWTVPLANPPALPNRATPPLPRRKPRKTRRLAR